MCLCTEILVYMNRIELRLSDDENKRLLELISKFNLKNKSEVLRFLIDKSHSGASSFRKDFPLLYLGNTMVGAVKNIQAHLPGTPEFDFYFDEIGNIATEMSKAIKLYNETIG